MVKVLIIKDINGNISHISSTEDIQYAIVEEYFDKDTTLPKIKETPDAYDVDSLVSSTSEFEDLYFSPSDKELIKNIKWLK